MGRRPETKGAIIALMSDGVARTSLEVANIIDCEKKYVRAVFADLVADGGAHIPEYRGANHEMVYRLGEGKNAKKPVNRTPEYLLARKRVKDSLKRTGKRQLSERELDRLYRARMPGGRALILLWSVRW
ncbi:MULTISPECIES: hypothetical protein [Paraburkholderia]|uniref:hypothetical protein n=1 Tax=Paraburkholderia TaxID=1822464 RepID=UPI00224D1720|nr:MULTISPECIES: hypothetical protein [Paraburkholderia]MCX4154976.1 hypothetical protein [Paraburkholderia aspalathi]MDN7164386.1 hypothetical protein [Paraburkholderia sp. SECH2]MDQ6392871.1 hypothetical protein [Paraburkholderia aspalathi]